MPDRPRLALTRDKQRGFTIVELLVVIVVMAVLATIAVVAYSGIQDRANNAAALNELVQWKKSFETYRAQEGVLPQMADGSYCLGSGFPIGGGGVARCRDYQATDNSYAYIESGNAALMTELRKVGTLPRGPRIPRNGTVGPYADFLGSSINLVMVIKGSAASDCPYSTNYSWTDGAGRLLCVITLNR